MKFYNVEELCADSIAEIKNLIPRVLASEFTIATFYRFLIPYIFPREIGKVIYLDSDLIINLDIAELWRFDLGDKILAVVPEIANYETHENMNIIHSLCSEGLVNAADYFNAGVLAVNLEILNKEIDSLFEGTKFIGSNSRYVFFDQDVLNYCFSTRTLKLPAKFNKFVWLTNVRENSAAGRNIYHYLPKPQALGLDMNIHLNRLWLEYFMKTPWFDAETIGRLYAGVQQVHMTLKRGMINTSAVMSGKTRAFYAFRQDFDALREIFGIRKDEKILSADEPDAVDKLIKEMKKSRGKKVFFIMPPNFPFQVLADAGLTPNCDYVNGFEFLSEEQGFPLNSYELIKAM